MSDNMERNGEPSEEERRRLMKDAYDKVGDEFNNFTGKHGLIMRYKKDTGMIGFGFIEGTWPVYNGQSEDLEDIIVKSPKEIKAKLDAYVIKQDYAKKVLATEVSSHYQALKFKEENQKIKKRNIMLLGPTGVGKTYIVERVAADLEVPFLTVNAPDFTAAGYVGDDVDNIARKLLDKAKGDITRAKRGIVYIDEIDKIAVNKGHGLDVGGEKVQNALLTLMEGKRVDKVPPHDTIGKMQDARHKEMKMAELMKNKGMSADEAKKMIESEEENTIDTSNILFIVGGSFAGEGNRASLIETIKKGMDVQTKSEIGFEGTLVCAQDNVESCETEASNYLKEVTPEHLVKYGMRPEFVGRITGIVPLENLNRDDLVKILKKKTDDGIIAQYKTRFGKEKTEEEPQKGWGIKLTFKESAYEAIADKAIKLQTGARSLEKTLSDALLEFEFQLFGNYTGELEVTKETIENPDKEIESFIAANPQLQAEVAL